MNHPDQPTSFHQPVKNHKRKAPLIVIILSIIILGLAGASTYFYLQYDEIKNNPQLINERETSNLTGKIGKLIALPADETPTIATVQDKSKLSNQAFFASVENGDKLLIYTKAQKAIIYRPLTNQIINVGPLSIDQDTGATNTK